MTERTRPVRIALADGSAVSGLATRPQITESVLVFAHGAGAGMTHPFMAAVASGLATRRIATLRYQFPYMQAGRHRVDSGPACHATVRAAVARASAMWPDVPLFAGGKSFGGRMTSQAQALAPLRGVSGLVFLGFPLHPAGKPSVDRAAHLVSIDVPMLFLHGSRDALAESALFSRMANDLGPLASPTELAGTDHGFHVLRRTGSRDDDVLEDLMDAIAVWTQAWRLALPARRGSGTRPTPRGGRS